MTLKRMAEYIKEVYSYEGPDGDIWDITIIKTEERKYVEISKEDEKHVWDVDMLLGIADAVRSVINKKTSHFLLKPEIGDSRPQAIQSAVNESMQNIDKSNIEPLHSLVSSNFNEDIQKRMSRTQDMSEKKVKHK